MRSARLQLAVITIVLAACDPIPARTSPPSPAPAASRADAPPPEYGKIEREIIHLVNVERSRNRLDALVWNSALDRAAKIQAVAMAAERKMAHDLPGAPYPTLGDRIRHTGYRYGRLAENIAYGFPSASYTVGAWMESPGHRANILDRAVFETGVGVARAKTGELYYCQVFGARLF